MKHPISGKYMSLPAALDWLALLLYSLIFVHGLVALPLLVECIRADGISLVELIGQDPCRRLFVSDESSCANNNSTAAVRLADPAVPCIDLTLESFGAAPKGADIPSMLMLVTDGLPDAQCAGMNLFHAQGISAIFKLAREPVSGAASKLHLTAQLRV